MQFFSLFISFFFAFEFTPCVCTLVPKETAVILYAVRIRLEWDTFFCCFLKRQKKFGADEKKNDIQAAQRYIINGNDKKKNVRRN